MDWFAGFAKTFSGYVWDTELAVLLAGAGLLFTLMTLGIQFKALTHGFAVIRGKYDNPEDEGNISHFKALCTALSATIGLGNISGVAVAVATGGAGAVFWMWVVGFLGMATKFMTCSLGTMYRRQDSDGTYRGGPMYYIEIGLGKNWKWLGVLFAVLGVAASIGAGNMFQSNQVSIIIRDLFQSQSETGLEIGTQNLIQYCVGIAMAVLAALVMIGGIKRIGNTASKIVPSMCVIYFVAAAYVILTNITAVPELLGSIFSEAFSGTAATGAFFGTAVRETVKLGVKRACFSNEAGLGSAPMAHATAKTNEPIREGVVAALGPFIDTIVICTMTALVILITQSHARVAIGEVVQVYDEKVVVGDEDDSKNGTWMQVDIRIKEEFQAEFARIGVGLMLAPPEASRKDRAAATLKLDTVRDGSIGVGSVKVPTSKREEWNTKTLPSLAPSNPVYLDKSGVSLTAYAFDKVIPGFGTWFLPFAAFLFAFSTVISWGYYGETCLTYLLGERVLLPFKLVYVVMVFVGATFAHVGPVLDFSDAMLGLMLIPNLIGTLLLAPRVMRAGRDYFERLRNGEFEEEVRAAAEAKARAKRGG